MNIINLEKLRNQPQLYRNAVEKKGIPLNIDELLELDEKRRALVKATEALRHERNKLTDAIAAGSDNRADLIAQAKGIGSTLDALQQDHQTVWMNWHRYCQVCPGLVRLMG